MGTTARGLGPMLVLLAASPAHAAATTPPLPPPRPVPKANAAPPFPLPPAQSRPSPDPIRVAPPDEVPLPPVRPADLRHSPELPPGSSPIPTPAQASDRPPAPVATAPAAPFPGAVPLEEAYACLRLWRGGTVEARLLPAIAPAGPGCGIGSPVEVAAVALDAGGRVRLEPPITVNCPMALATAAWVREDLAPAFAATGSPLTALTGTSGYACRGRNGVAGAQPSEHGLGHAVDIGGFVRADRDAVGVRQTDAPVLAQVRATACARFATVLGPGSDGFHEAHLHVDIEERRNRFAICHWDRP